MIWWEFCRKHCFREMRKRHKSYAVSQKHKKLRFYHGRSFRLFFHSRLTKRAACDRMSVGRRGLRQSKTVDGVTTSFVLDGMYVAAETSGETSTYYSRGVNLISRSTGESKDYYYMNSHGDVTKLVNSSGTVVVDYTYDAFGNQTGETEDSNPFRYAGEYWDSESGLIYLRARYYDSGVGGFISEDPAKDGFNWYIYCNNNPINFIDALGLAPTAMEAAEMAEHIYKDIPLSDNSSEAAKAANRAARTVAGWRLIDVYSKGSFKMGVYIRDGDDWRNPSEYVLVSKGTSAVNDWDDNLLQPLGGSGDMKLSLDIAKWFSDSHTNQEITFVGHSKGGGEAMANAVATNRNAITFNPAKANLAIYSETKNARKSYTGTMTHYVVEGEILNDKFGNPSMGTTVKLPTQVAIEPWTFAAWGQRTDNHHMWAVKAALREAGY